MKHRWLLAALASLPLLSFGADGLSDLQWKKRILLIVTPTLEDTRYQQQAAELLPAWPELNARNLEVIVALPGDPRRDRLAAKPDEFLVALIGLDGGVKLARRDVVARATLYREIESASLQRTEKNAAERAQRKAEAPASP